VRMKANLVGVSLMAILLADVALCSEESRALTALQSADVKTLTELADSGFDFSKLPKDAYEAAVSKWNPSQRQQVMDLIYAKPEAFMGERWRHYTKLLSLVSAGTFTWSIPWKYHAEGTEKEFVTVDHVKELTIGVNGKAELEISKAGASQSVSQP
jgi:hypothetical protein